HGSLPVATVEQARAIKSAVYVAHGEADNFVPAERVAAFQSALNDAGVDLQFASFPDARHSFTNPGADALGMENLRYHKDADQQSWQQLQKFFNKIFN
ncbi:MAG: dienelactone hydrolase family protein, partial [Gammaproteobacteria bacterium]|nr:dienelactone hydrolase family protein [Gammaproteobacteria bacterium]